jgi:alkylation response protein AidB-like acyl-CoA dehydrogenase
MTVDDDRLDLAAEVRLFLAAEGPPPVHATLDDRFAYLVAYERRLDEAGLAVPAWPVEYGGRGLGPRSAAAVSRALGAGGAPELINFVGIDVLGPALLRFASPADLRSWLPPMAAAEEIWCQLFSEPDAGSDLASLRTRAERLDDGRWRIDGAKIWSTWAQYARWGLLLARTGDQEARHRAITAFVVDMTTPGIEVRPLVTMTGSAEFAEVFFTGAELPADAVLGEVDDGWQVARVILDAERGPYAIRRAAVIGAALARAIDAARSRPAGAASRQVVSRAVTSFRLLDLRIERMVDALDKGEDVGADAPLTKQLMSAAEQTVFDLCHRLLGPGGAATCEPGHLAITEDYLYSRAASIYGGTAQIQRNILAERNLRLPR